MNNILVTGSNGQLGNEIRQFAPQSKTNEYYFTDVEELDITDLSAIRTFVLNYNINANQGLKYQIDERSGDSSKDMHKQSLC